MSKNGFKKSTISNSTIIPSSINDNSSNCVSNTNLNQNNPNFSIFSNLDNLDDDSDFFAPSKTKVRPGKIIHQSTEHSIDKRGIRVVKTKTIREIDSINDIPKNRNKKIKIIAKNKSQSNYNNYNKNIIKKNISKNLDIKTFKSKKAEINSPDLFQGSPNYNKIISPVGYVPYYSSESDFDDYHMKSFDINNKKNNKKRKNIKIVKNIQSINYELEDPEGFDYLRSNEINRGRNLSKGYMNNKKAKLTEIILNKSEFYNNNRLINNSYQSDFRDFQSPDRDITNQNKFRKITENMLDSKGPSNDDKKVTKSIKTKINMEKNVYIKKYKNKKIINNNNMYNNNNLSQIEAAKIIQKWWRNSKYREEEVYDITVKTAIKLQSFIRGYLVRKKVLRYITLAIYYQSFCDKLQDVLCNHVKKNIFNELKIYKKPKIKKSSTNMINITNNNNSRSFISSIGYKSPLTYQSPLTFINTSEYNNNTNINNYSQYINNYKHRNVLKKHYLKEANTSMNNIRNKILKNNHKNNIVENYETVKTTKRIITSNMRQINRKKSKNEIISGGTLSIIKLPNRRINYSESEDIFTHIKETQKKIYSSNNIKTNYNEEQKRKSDSNKIFEKIIIREELKPETAEDGNNRQIFSMEISNNVNMAIKASLGTKRVTKEEIKELEIIKKREKQNNKKIKIYKKNYETEKNKNKLSNLKHAIKIVEYHKKSIFKKIFEKLRQNSIKKNNKDNKDNKDMTYEIQTANDIQIKQNLKEKKDFSLQISPEKTEEGIQANPEQNIKKLFMKKLLITENRSISFEGKERNNQENNKIISNDKLKILSNIKKEEFGHQIGSWETKIEKNENNNINIINEKPKLIETGIQYQTSENKITKTELDIISKTSKEDKKWNPVISKVNNEINIINVKPEKIEEGSQYSNIKNKIEKNDDINIIQERPKLVDTEIQHEPQDNFITKSKLDIISKISKNDESSQVEEIILTRNNNKISKIKDDINIISKKPEKVDECTQYVKLENIIGKTKEYKILSKKKDLTEKGIQPEKIENKISKSKLAIISKQSTKDKIWIKPWNPIISRNHSAINFIPSTQKQKTIETGIQYIQQENSIYKIKDINIIHNRPKLIDTEIQHDLEENIVDKKNKLQIEIKSNKEKPQYKDEVTQCDLENNQTMDEGINTVNEEDLKPKKIEIKIRTVKRSIHEIEIPLLKKIWLRKAFKTFKQNCQRPAYHKIIKKELLRMYLLKWRFIKGYGPDRYGNIYDRNGILLYKTKGKVVDEQIQQEFVIEKEEQSTQYTPIENVISTLKQMEIKGIQKIKKEIEKNDIAVGNDTILLESIQRSNELSYKNNKKEKKINEIFKNFNIEIKHKEKILKDESTNIENIPYDDNKISNIEKISITNEDYVLKKKISSRKKTLLTQMIYKKIINEKLILCDYLRKWLKQTLNLSHKIQKKNSVKITQNDKFSLIEKIQKAEMGTQIEQEENKIENTEKINIINIIEKKDYQINVNFPNKFNIINPQNQTNISYQNQKKIPVLKIEKENNVNILGENNFINYEEIKIETEKRITEILYKCITSKNTTKSIIKKYFYLWLRKANYLTLMENARIITDFCRNNLDKAKIYKKWKKISEKLIIKEKIKIIKKTEIIYSRKNKIMDLIRLTRFNSIYAKRRYLHYILLSWFALTKDLSKKKQHIKNLYENMLNTYMNMADDIFGNNKNQNQSVQEAMNEVATSNKYSIKEYKDVPKAEDYYKNRREPPKISTNTSYINKNKIYIKKEIIQSTLRENTSTTFVKKEVKIKENERLHSKGRGRKYRTKAEKEILNKFGKNSYNNKREKLEKENLSMNEKENTQNNNIKLNKDKIKYSTEIKKQENINRGNETSHFNYSFNKKMNKDKNDLDKISSNIKDENENNKNSFFI